MAGGGGHMAGGKGGDIWQGLGTCGRVWGHVAGGGSMWQGMEAYGRGWRHMEGLWAYGRGRDRDMWQGEGTCSRVWGHVTGGRGMWLGLICENMTNIKKSNMLTLNEAHKNFNLT